MNKCWNTTMEVIILKRSLLLTLIVLLCAVSASMGYYGGSNMGYFYPSFSEIPPSKPYSSDEYSISQYRREVEEYIAAAEEYVSNAKGDIELIRESINNATNEANAVIDEYNLWARTGY